MKEQANSNLVRHVRKNIRKKGIIGKVFIEEMVGRTIANLSLSEFDKLRDFQLRDAGDDIT
jgi:hypothetical protein